MREGGGISIDTLLPVAAEFKFDDQDSVRKTLEELHSGQGQNDYFGKYFQSHVDLASVQDSLKRFFTECVEALESKARFNDARARLDKHEVVLHDLPKSEMLILPKSERLTISSFPRLSLLMPSTGLNQRFVFARAALTM